MTKKEALKIAATLLKEIAENAVDDIAFKVEAEDNIVDNCIHLIPDDARRTMDNDTGKAFFHMEKVVDICRALGLHFWIRAQIDEENKPTFEVNIY